MFYSPYMSQSTVKLPVAAPPTDAMTYTLWFYMPSTAYTAGCRIMFSTNLAISLIVNSDRSFTAGITMRTSGSKSISLPVVGAGAWHFIACTWKSTPTKFKAQVDRNAAIESSLVVPDTKLYWVTPTATVPEYISFTYMAVGSTYPYQHILKNFRLYSYYMTTQQLLVNQYLTPLTDDPYLLLYAMFDDSYPSYVYDPANRLVDAVSCTWNTVTDLRDLSLAVSGGGFRESLTAQITKDSALTFCPRSSTVVLELGTKAWYILFREGFYARMQVRATLPISDKVLLFHNVETVSAYLGPSDLRPTFTVFNNDTSQFETFAASAAVPNATWAWLTFRYDPLVPTEVMIGIDDNCQAFSTDV